MKRVSVLLTLIAMNIYSCNPNIRVVEHKDCCSITVKHLPHINAYVVTWSDHLSSDTYEEFVDVEYPDADMTPQEELEFELAWAIAEFKELCWTQHKIN